MEYRQVNVGDAVTLTLELQDGMLRSLGRVTINGVDARSPATRFTPWFDTYDGEVFRAFRLSSIERSAGGGAVLHLVGLSDPDAVFRERRDSSGDVCLRSANWDAPPIQVTLRVHLEPTTLEVDGRRFAGFRYWYEYASDDVPIHRLLDRQTWELGGSLDDVTLVCRNWLTPPRVRLRRELAYSTVGLDQWAHLLPGNLWGRWTLLPGFDMQYGATGVLVGLFDEVSLIRSVLESNAGEDCLRITDVHYFQQSNVVRTNAKTILHSPDVLDDTEALNLWTRLQDRDRDLARAQFAIPTEPPPAVWFHMNHWKHYHFDTSYEHVVDVASEFGADYVFIDPVWEHGQAYRQALDAVVPEEKRKGTILAKQWTHNMCATLDFTVAAEHGGEDALRRLCERSAAKGVRIISWMAMHYSPIAMPTGVKGHGDYGMYAAKESGRHPDTGYANACWPINLNSPAFDRVREQILGTCERTGLAGFLWDSFCNLGWWQVDYSKGDMRPQYQKMAALYADLVKAGLFITPEAIVSFSSNSCCGMHGGNVYAGNMLGYSYDTSISLDYHDGRGALEKRILTGELSTDVLFRSLAHRRVPSLGLHEVPREQWDPIAATEIKRLLATYRAVRARMVQRTVLPNDLGVLWLADTSEEAVLFAFTDITLGDRASSQDVAAGGQNGQDLRAGRVYIINGAAVTDLLAATSVTMADTLVATTAESLASA